MEYEDIITYQRKKSFKNHIINRLRKDIDFGKEIVFNRKEFAEITSTQRKYHDHVSLPKRLF
jgi:hypothetical protein